MSFIFNCILIGVEVLLSFCGLVSNKKGDVVELVWALIAEPPGKTLFCYLIT